MGKPQIQDLLEDLEFIRWVKSPDADLNRYWNSWIEANPIRIEDVKLAKEIILNMTFPAKEASSDVKREVLNRLLLESSPPSTEKEDNQFFVRSFFWIRMNQFTKIAAILVFCILLSFLFKNLLHFDKATPVGQNIQWISKKTNYGEKLNFRLPDGTVVWLNAGSSLHYPESFDSTVRLVRLKGEGFFEVAEDASKPFKVQSEGLTTTALGTSFNINSFNKNELKVSLVTGKVRIDGQADSQAYFLVPGQEFGINSENQQARISKFDVGLVQSWRNGKLIFCKAPFDQVKDKLERWYGVSITVDGGPSNGWRFTGKFENQTLETILTSMSNIEDFSFKINDKYVKIKF